MSYRSKSVEEAAESVLEWLSESSGEVTAEESIYEWLVEEETSTELYAWLTGSEESRPALTEAAGNRVLLEDGTATAVLTLQKVKISGHQHEIGLTLGSSGRWEGYFWDPIHLPKEQAKIVQTTGKDIEITGRIQIDESGTRRDYDATKDDKDWPLKGAQGSVDVKVVKSDGPASSTISKSKVAADGTFTFTATIGVGGYTRSLTLFPQVELKGGKKITAKVVLELNDLDHFISLVDPKETARPSTQTHLEFLASVRKIYQGGPKDPLSGAFDLVLYRNRNVPPLVAPGSADEKLFKLSKLYFTGDFIFADREFLDVGHVLTGIEGSRNQEPAKDQSVPMPPARRELIVTWAGDLGSALKAYIKDFWTALDTGASIDLNTYLKNHVSQVDMIGDIDGINIGAVYDASLSLANNLRAYYGKKSRKRFKEFIKNSKDASGNAELPTTGTTRPKLSKQAKQTIADHVHKQFLLPSQIRGSLYHGTDATKRKLVDDMILPGSPEMGAVVDYFAQFLEDGLALEP